jgi:transposase
VIAVLHTVPQYETPEYLLGEALCEIKAVTSSKQGYAIGPDILARNWGIGQSTAKRTLEATTQSGVRTVLNPTLSRRFRTNDRQLRCRRIAHEVFTDTLETSVPSWHRQNRYAQVFATSFGWIRVYPMKRKSDAHEGLSSLMARRDGVPRSIIMDGSKEQTLGVFRKKAREMGVHIKQTEPYSPWQNASEGAIHELKRSAGRKMSKAKSPAKLWDHCLELEGYIRSHTALDIYELKGEVPETIVSGMTADISPYVECGWYDWVKYWDTTSSFPNSKEVYGKWLGPAPDIGPAMCSKRILKSNGHLLHLSTYRPITDDELHDPAERKLRKDFDRKILRKLGKAACDFGGAVSTGPSDYYTRV